MTLVMLDGLGQSFGRMSGQWEFVGGLSSDTGSKLLSASFLVVVKTSNQDELRCVAEIQPRRPRR